MDNKYEKLTEPGRMINNIFANISAGMEAGKNLKRCSVLKQGNTGYSDTSKPLDVLFKDTDKVVDKFYQDIDKIGFKKRKKVLDPYIKTLIEQVKQFRDISEGYKFETITLKKENKELKRKLHRFDEIFNNFESKRKEINNNKRRMRWETK